MSTFDGERCHTCDGPVGVWWSASEDLWSEVVGDPHTIRCVRCFAEQARQAGRPVMFEAVEQARRAD